MRQFEITPKHKKIKKCIGFYPFELYDHRGDYRIGLLSPEDNQVLYPLSVKDFFYKVSKNNDIPLIDAGYEYKKRRNVVTIYSDDISFVKKDGLSLYKKFPYYINNDPVDLSFIFTYRDCKINARDYVGTNKTLALYYTFLCHIIEDIFYNPNTMMRVTVPFSRMTDYEHTFYTLHSKKVPLFNYTYSEFFDSATTFYHIMNNESIDERLSKQFVKPSNFMQYI